MGLLMGMTPWSVFSAAAKSVFDRQSITLLCLVSTIMVLSRLMEDSGQLNRIVSSFNKTVGNRKIALIVMPALIGLLPMPGGALFSAPMVETKVAFLPSCPTGLPVSASVFAPGPPRT